MPSESLTSNMSEGNRGLNLLVGAGYIAGSIAIASGVIYEVTETANGVGEIVGGLGVIAITKLGSIALKR